MTDHLKTIRDGLERLARLGNGDYYGNSDGNVLAQQLLPALDALEQAMREPLAELVDYILQDDIHNRLTPRVVDIAYSAFMIGRSGKNKDNGGPCDWFNDTKPMVIEQMAKIRRDLAEATPPAQQAQPTECPNGDACKHGSWCTETYCQEHCQFKQAQAEAVPNRAFLERTLAAMEGVIDVADRKTDEFEAMRSCIVDLTLMLYANKATKKGSAT